MRNGQPRFLSDRTIYDPDEPIDTLLVGGDPAFDEMDPAVPAWLARRAPTVRRYGSVCTGVFFLAAAGLLDGRRVTTHWECADKLRNDFPNLVVDDNQIFIRDGALCTTAGVTAGMDLALALVEEDFGRELALIVARYMVMFLKRPGGVAIQRPSRGADVDQEPDPAGAGIRPGASSRGPIGGPAGASLRNEPRATSRGCSGAT